MCSALTPGNVVIVPIKGLRPLPPCPAMRLPLNDGWLSGKTTIIAKIAGKLKAKAGRNCWQRCASVRVIKQLQVNEEKGRESVFSMGAKNKPVDTAKACEHAAKTQGTERIILDTAVICIR